MNKRERERLERLNKQASFWGASWGRLHRIWTQEEIDRAALEVMQLSTQFARWSDNPEYVQRWQEAFRKAWLAAAQPPADQESEAAHGPAENA